MNNAIYYVKNSAETDICKKSLFYLDVLPQKFLNILNKNVFLNLYNGKLEKRQELIDSKIKNCTFIELKGVVFYFCLIFHFKKIF